ncbi:MAG: envelope stress response membrane protein PspB [Sphingomonadales bacterium]|uniref:envelope stress response membrane protein PspB n=1 Tax=unclassified Novosphingobium TaxID=2644732 RepID=UPI0006B9C92B|nr:MULTISPECIES: envelope stress response membrane protein PspB [unclassified Novosphingobium]KPF78237.1 phage shock protein B [Novosphingobium sp. AAP93]MBU6396382.1 envelope stress response membrane protein PspB [Sphingomonadales bacterium]
MEDIVVPLIAMVSLFIAFPWVVLHYITKWKTAATLTSGDEALLEELYQLARRLDERMDTVERLVAADNPEFRPARLLPDRDEDNQKLRELDRMLAAQRGTSK